MDNTVNKCSAASAGVTEPRDNSGKRRQKSRGKNELQNTAVGMKRPQGSLQLLLSQQLVDSFRETSLLNNVYGTVRDDGEGHISHCQVSQTAWKSQLLHVVFGDIR